MTVQSFLYASGILNGHVGGCEKRERKKGEKEEKEEREKRGVEVKREVRVKKEGKKK